MGDSRILPDDESFSHHRGDTQVNAGGRDEVVFGKPTRSVLEKAKGGSVGGLDGERICLGCCVSRPRGTFGVDCGGAVNNTRGRVCSFGYLLGTKKGSGLLGAN